MSQSHANSLTSIYRMSSFMKTLDHAVCFLFQTVPACLYYEGLLPHCITIGPLSCVCQWSEFDRMKHCHLHCSTLVMMGIQNLFDGF